MEMSLDDKEMQQGDPARYGSEIGQWPMPLPGAATARHCCGRWRKPSTRGHWQPQRERGVKRAAEPADVARHAADEACGYFSAAA